MGRYSNLSNATTDFAKMLGRFGVVTVMNAKVYDTSKLVGEGVSIKQYFANKTASDVYSSLEGSNSALLCTLDTLKIANITTEGPTKTVNGGQYSNPLIKFGKSARLEMQDALGNNKALDALCGTISEYSDAEKTNALALHVTEDFVGPRTIVGETFFIDQKTGRQVPVRILFYQFLPDSIFNLTQDAEGDATVFDMNGDLMTTNIKVGTDGTNAGEISHGVFYSIIGENDSTATGNPGLPSRLEMKVGEVKVYSFNEAATSSSSTTGAATVQLNNDKNKLTITAASAGEASVTTIYKTKSYVTEVVVS